MTDGYDYQVLIFDDEGSATLHIAPISEVDEENILNDIIGLANSSSGDVSTIHYSVNQGS